MHTALASSAPLAATVLTIAGARREHDFDSENAFEGDAVTANATSVF